MHNHPNTRRLLLFAATLAASLPAMAGDSVQAKIERAMSAAPAAVSAEATVMDTDGTTPCRVITRRCAMTRCG